MFDAFEIVRLVEKLPLKICSIATWDDRFMVGTVSSKSEAHLLVYKVQCADYDRYEAKLDKTLKKFTAKPIQQLAVIPEHHIFLMLTTDGELHCASLTLFAVMQSLPRTRGVVTFAVDWLRVKGYAKDLRVCVAMKKKLIVYQWKDRAFLPTHDLPIVDTPRGVAWIESNLIVCIRKDLYLMQLNGNAKELFSIGTNRSEPCMLAINGGELLVLKDEKQISLDKDARPTQNTPLVWSDLPSSIEHIHPYVIGILPKGIEVRALEQKINIHTLKAADQIKFITHHTMTLVASQYQVYKLEPRAYDVQVQQLVMGRQFELALEVAELIKESEEEHKFRREEILRRFAFYLFTQYKFKESLEHYLLIKEDPVNVIGLYPHLLPPDLRQSVTQPLPVSPPTLSGEDLIKGMEQLIRYLTQMRYTDQQKLQQHQKGEVHLLPDQVTKMKARLRLIDTTLLKCYLKTGNSGLTGSLVRLPDNHLHLEESERVLRKYEKFQELVQLYKTKHKHKNALELLSNFRNGPTGPLSGVHPTIQYLQGLGRDNIDLIFSHSKWVLEEDGEEGLRIFTEDTAEVENLPRFKVLSHIKSHAPRLVMPYMEHIIHRWGDKTSTFHSSLILMYKDMVEELLKQYLDSIRGRPRAKAGSEPGELGFMRSKLLNFLESSKFYRPEDLISKFPESDLFEERALLLGKLGRHGVALAIYAHVLQDPQMAEDYCRKIYNPEREESKEVYLSLIETYLHPPSLNELGIRLPHRTHTQPVASVDAAMKVLAEHHEHINTAKAMEMIPEDTPIQSIKEFLTKVLQESTVHKRRSHVLRSLLLADNLRNQKMRIKQQSPYFVINDNTLCSICKRHLKLSAFARFPNGAIAHYYCFNKIEKQHEEEESDIKEDISAVH